MTTARLRLGKAGEDLACAAAQRGGMTVLDRNCRTRFGEIDAIAIDGETLVFIEVKTLRDGARFGPERPAVAVGRRKQIQVRRLARAWLAENAGPRYRAIRFDVIGVSLDPSGSPRDIEHIPDAF